MPAPKTAEPPSPEDLVTRARKRFLAGERIDIETLAEELGISRATAYRWAGNNETLVGEVIASMTEMTFHRTLKESRGKGAALILEVLERGMRAIVGSRVYREFLERDPQRALRIVASKEGPSQRRAIALHQGLLEDQIARGHLSLEADPHTVAYALVRLGESFLYADLIAGEQPDVDKAMQVFRLMLR